MSRERLDEDLQIRGGIDSLSDEVYENDPDDISDQSDMNPRGNITDQRGCSPDDEAYDPRADDLADLHEDDSGGDDFVPDNQSKRRKQRPVRDIRRGDTMKESLFAIFCVMIGFLGIIGIIVGVIIATGLYRPQNPNTNTNQAANSGNVYYDQNGNVHVNIYVTRKPDVDVNITIDGDGNVTAESSNGTHAEIEAPEIETEPTVSEDTIEEDIETEESTEDTSESDEPEITEGSDIPANEDQGSQTSSSQIKTEEEILKDMQDRIKNGKPRFSEDDMIYDIVWGDTLSQISHLTGYSVDFLAAYNQIKDKNLIIAGETLHIPSYGGVD